MLLVVEPVRRKSSFRKLIIERRVIFRQFLSGCDIADCVGAGTFIVCDAQIRILAVVYEPTAVELDEQLSV